MSELTLSTSSIMGKFKNIHFSEKHYNLPITDNIIHIKSNFCEKKHPSFIQMIKPVVQRKIKNLSYVQGNGTSFNSQISFLLILNGTLMRIKVFRNGKFFIPGLHNEDILLNFLNVLEEYFKIHISPKCSIDKSSFQFVLRNYKTIILRRFDINDIYNKLNSKLNEYIRINSSILKSFELPLIELDNYFGSKFEFVKKTNIKCLLDEYNASGKLSDITKYIDHEFFIIGLSTNLSKTCLMLRVKKFANIITIKIFNTGKCNLDGNQSEEEANFYNNWIYKEILF